MLWKIKEDVLWYIENVMVSGDVVSRVVVVVVFVIILIMLEMMFWKKDI